MSQFPQDQSRRKLAPREIAKTVKLLSRVTPVPFMETLVFKALWRARLMPMTTLELFIFERDPFTPAAKTLPRVLLSYRKDEYYDGWHVPGGYLGAKETAAQAVRRILMRELGSGSRTIQHLFTLNRPNGIREHHCSWFLAATLLKPPRLKKGRLEYFDPSRLPLKLLPYYREAFARLKKIHAFLKTLPKDKQRKLLECLSVSEVSGKM